MLSANDRRSSLSPRDLAQAAGVSESSIKRWVDAGRIPSHRTRGGHRRIDRAQALRFLRESGTPLLDLAPLGLELPPAEELGRDQLGDRVHELLSQGQAEELAALLMGLLVTRQWELSALCDGPLRDAMRRIGELWHGGREGIFVEHRATATLLDVLDRIDELSEGGSRGVAVGGSLGGDPSLVPSRMVATVLAAEGFEVVQLGADTPPEVLAEAAFELGADLAWLSISYVQDPERQRADLLPVLNALRKRGVRCIVGGRAAREVLGSVERRARIGDTMGDLVDFARRTEES